MQPLAKHDESLNASGAWLHPSDKKINLRTFLAPEPTRNVGTGSYIAPEVENSAASKKAYDSKCDIFSLGIVLFEMFFRPLPNGMERIEILKQLRNRIQFPDDFGIQITMEYRKDKIKGLLKSMLAYDPTNRPTVEELLEDERIPFVENEQTEFERKFGPMLRNRKSNFHQWVLDELFSLGVPSSIDYLYDSPIATDERCEEPRHQALISMVSKCLRDIFHLHGLTEVASHLLVPFHQPETSSLYVPFKTLDRSGILLSLSPDLRQSFARYCARNAIQNIRRFAFGKVVTTSTDNFGSGVHPKERHECAVDFIAPTQYASNFSAEILHLIVELKKQLPVLVGLKYTIRLGHSKLLEAICAMHGCHENVLKNIQNFLHFSIIEGQKHSIEERASQLSQKVKLTKQTALAIIRQLEPIESLDEFKTRITRLVRTKPSEIQKPAMFALNEINQTLENLMHLCGKSRNLRFLL